MNWISCKDEMPELLIVSWPKTTRHSETVMFVYDDHWVLEGALWSDGEGLFWMVDIHNDFENSEKIPMGAVSFWMDIPEPPKGWHPSYLNYLKELKQKKEVENDK